MEYLINQVAADIGVGDWGANCLESSGKGAKSDKKSAENGQGSGSDKHWLRPLVGGARTRLWLQTAAILAITDHIVSTCTVLYCTVLITLCGPVLCVHCDQLRSSSQVSSCEGRRRNDGTRGQHTRCQQNSRMAKHVD